MDEPAPLAPIAVRIREACRLTGIGRSKPYMLIGQGHIETIKVASMTLIPMRSLETFLGEKRAGAEPGLCAGPHPGLDGRWAAMLSAAGILVFSAMAERASSSGHVNVYGSSQSRSSNGSQGLRFPLPPRFATVLCKEA
jgi:excisionase family DNA binding protein